MMDSNGKLKWCRSAWSWLKEKEKLEIALQKIIDQDAWFTQIGITVQDIIDIEEGIDKLNNKRYLT